MSYKKSLGENYSSGKIIHGGSFLSGEYYSPGKILSLTRQNSVALPRRNIPPIITKIQKRLCNVFVGDVRTYYAWGGAGRGGFNSMDKKSINLFCYLQINLFFQHRKTLKGSLPYIISVPEIIIMIFLFIRQYRNSFAASNFSPMYYLIGLLQAMYISGGIFLGG